MIDRSSTRAMVDARRGQARPCCSGPVSRGRGWRGELMAAAIGLKEPGSRPLPARVSMPGARDESLRQWQGASYLLVDAVLGPGRRPRGARPRVAFRWRWGGRVPVAALPGWHRRARARPDTGGRASASGAREPRGAFSRRRTEIISQSIAWA